MKTSLTLGLATASVATMVVAGVAASSDAAPGAVVPVTGTETHSVVRNSTFVTLKTDPIATGDTEGDPVAWKILVGPAGHTLHQRLATTMGAGETVDWNYTFPTTLSTRQIQVYKNGTLVSAYNFTP
ncbi:hypothetical protein D9V37_06150 [Nocardioides mangrovicus]|uniref:Uncharacterized protein n=1 Tax=Nocardioides mangrovicus TaxID=2478913 RepID=A0A3L8P481_9ACTN|nr:hypothetical protein [Nocardioides mangrovicus]RLV49513.1 hypothetical protein D9V37_06150 [Nocardioides mangrovicus]